MSDTIQVQTTKCRVVPMKLKEVEGDFSASFNRVSEATKAMFNEIVCWGNDEVYRNGVAVNVGNERAKLYGLTNKGMTFEQFESALRFLYNITVNAGKGRDVASVLMGVPREQVLVSDWNKVVEASKDQKVKKNTPAYSGLAYEVCNSLVAIGFRNRFPYTSSLSAGERYAVVGNIHRMLTSWKECEKLTVEQYAKEKDAIAEEVRKIDDDKRTLMMEFMDFCVSNDIVKHFDERIRKYMKDCLIPCLSGGVPVKEHFFLQKDGKSEKKIQFSLDDKFCEYLKEHPSLWSGNDPFILSHLYVLEMYVTHMGHLPHANYPFFSGNSDEDRRIGYLLGDNYERFSMEYSGKDLDDVELANDKKEDKQTFSCGKEIGLSRVYIETHGSRFQVCLKDSYHDGSVNPGEYFRNIRMWKNAEKTPYHILLSFQRHGKSFFAVVKEPSIVKRGQEYHVRMNMNIILEQDEKTSNASWVLRSAYPSAQTSRQKIAEKNPQRLALATGTTVTAMGVDLGKRAPFAYAVGQFTVSPDIDEMGKVKIVGKGLLEQSPSKAYDEMLFDLVGASKFIGANKGMAKEGALEVEMSWKTANLFSRMRQLLPGMVGQVKGKKLGVLMSFMSKNDDEIMGETKRLILEYGMDLESVKKDFRWYGMAVSYYLDRRFNAIREDRQFCNDPSIKFDNEFRWIECIERMKRYKRAVSYLGMKITEDSPRIVLKDLVSYHKGCKDNYLKQISSAIVQTAVENGCKVIVLEDLENENAVLNSRNQNFLFSLWSPKRIKGAIENAAQWHGIECVYVSPGGTSQVAYETGLFGYRDRDSFYSYDLSGNLVKVNSDENAAANILVMAASRHTQIRQVNIQNVKSGTAGLRIKGMLTKEFGNVDNAVRSLSAIKDEDSDYVYRHGNKWISASERNAIREEIKQKVEGMGNRGNSPEANKETKTPTETKKETNTPPETKKETKTPTETIKTKESPSKTKATKDPVDPKTAKKGPAAKEMTESQVRSVVAARDVSKMSWKDIESFFGLRPTNGMTAYRAYHVMAPRMDIETEKTKKTEKTCA